MFYAFIKPVMKYLKLSFPLVGNLSFTHMKKDVGQAGMTGPNNTLLNCRVNNNEKGDTDIP